MNNSKIVCIGDSITYGYELDPSQRWTYLLGRELNLEVVNHGVNGDTTAGMLARFHQQAVQQQASHVIITGGTNDLWFGLRDELIISNIFAMCRQAKFHEIVPIVGIPTPSFNLNELNFLHEDYAECLRSFQNTLLKFCRDKDIASIDFSKHFTGEHVMDDGLHPNVSGQLVMMGNALEVIQLQLGKN